MKPVFEYTKGMRETELHYCPGCTHGIAHRLIMEVLEERGDLGNCIAVSPVGCSIVAHQYMNVDMIESPHGRAPLLPPAQARASQLPCVYLSGRW